MFPTRHPLVSTVDYIANTPDPCPEDIDGLDDDEGQEQSLLPVRHGKTTSWYDMCMKDTPHEALEDDKKDPVENKPPGTQPENRHPRPHRPRENTANTREDDTPDNKDAAEVESEQDEQEGGQDSSDEQTTYGDEDFIMPKEPLEQERFKC